MKQKMLRDWPREWQFHDVQDAVDKPMVTFVAELDADVDDIIAAEWLREQGVLECLVLDPWPKHQIGLERLESLKDLHVRIEDKIPTGTKRVLVGGALTALARYLRLGYEVEDVVIQGGFLGANILGSATLPKFKGMDIMRTFNFNLDIVSTQYVLDQATGPEGRIKRLYTVGKNVCHSMLDTLEGFWSLDPLVVRICKKYNVKPIKKLHDLLMAHEAAHFLGLLDYQNNWIAPVSYCDYRFGAHFCHGVGKFSQWGFMSRMTPNEDLVRVESARKFRGRKCLVSLNAGGWISKGSSLSAYRYTNDLLERCEKELGIPKAF